MKLAGIVAHFKILQLNIVGLNRKPFKAKFSYANLLRFTKKGNSSVGTSSELPLFLRNHKCFCKWSYLLIIVDIKALILGTTF
jgi:hypothetical protein